MQCDICGNEAVIYQAYSGRHLCGRHLAADIEARAKRTIRSHRWLRTGDHIAVPLSGDRKSAALLCFLQRLTAVRRDICLITIPGGENRAGDHGRSAAVKVAESLRIPCGEMRDDNSFRTAARSTVTKIALAISLDDIAQGVLNEFLFGNAGRLVQALPDYCCQFPVIFPFMAVPSDEIDIYWALKETGISLPPLATSGEFRPRETEALLDDYTKCHPATKYALLHLAEQLTNNNPAAII